MHIYKGGPVLVVSFQAQQVITPSDEDLDYGIGAIWFEWPDIVYGHEGLGIDLDGFCSRRMPIRSGQGPPLFVEVERGRILVRFPPTLAIRLELDELVEIHFQIDDDDFRLLQRTVDFIRENGVESSS